jgi:hypothetical protein
METDTRRERGLHIARNHPSSATPPAKKVCLEWIIESLNVFRTILADEFFCYLALLPLPTHVFLWMVLLIALVENHDITFP